jgi:hypothetical protein
MHGLREVLVATTPPNETSAAHRPYAFASSSPVPESARLLLWALWKVSWAATSATGALLDTAHESLLERLALL